MIISDCIINMQFAIYTSYIIHHVDKQNLNITKIKSEW